jgi:UDP-3-O-[3-hydroxymyristoyl] glucosamine N-acyltransferase
MKVHQEHFIHPGATIATTAVIGNNVVIGDGVTIGSHAVIEDYSIIGEGTLIGPHVCIGSRGMQNTRFEGKFLRVEFAGGVKIGRNCEILTAAIVQKPYHCDYTEIGDDVQVSVKVNVAHNVKIGARSMLAGNSQIGGNAVLEEDVWIGQAAAICDGIRIGRGAQVKMGSVVVSSVKPGQVVSGNFAIEHSLTLKHHARAKSEKS